MYIIILILIIVLAIDKAIPFIEAQLQKRNGRRAENIFEHYYIESKAFYVYRFNNIPCTTFIDDIDLSKAFSYIRDTYADNIVDVYQACYYDREEGKQVFNKTCFVLNNKTLIELGNSYAKVLFANNNYDLLIASSLRSANTSCLKKRRVLRSTSLPWVARGLN
jgi:hypothetical protein